MIVQANNKSLAEIFLFVLAVHIVLIFWVIFAPSSFNKPIKPSERLIVKTVQLNPVQAHKPKVASPIQKQEPAPTKIEESPPKIVEAPPKQIEQPKESKPMVKDSEPIKPVEQKPIEIKKETPKPQTAKPSSPKKTQEKQPTKKSDSPKKQEPKKNSPKKESTPKKSNTKKTETPVKNEKPKVDPAKVKAQQEADEKQRKLIAAAQESIAKIDQGRVKMSAVKSSQNVAIAAPAAITSLQIDALPIGNASSLTPGEANYRDELASLLKLRLKLPEHGDVQLKLTLDRTGKVIKVNIVKSASQVNRAFVEKTLPTLKFPSFGNNFENVSDYIFNILLSNEL